MVWERVQTCESCSAIVRRISHTTSNNTFLMSEVPLWCGVEEGTDVRELLGCCVVWCGFRRGLVFQALRLLHHSTLGSRVIKKKKKGQGTDVR